MPSSAPNSPLELTLRDLEEGQVSSHYPEKELNGNRTAWGQIRTALFNRWINVLLVFAPVGIAMHYAGINR